jgi:hypothetical protein
MHTLAKAIPDEAQTLCRFMGLGEWHEVHGDVLAALEVRVFSTAK